MKEDVIAANLANLRQSVNELKEAVNKLNDGSQNHEQTTQSIIRKSKFPPNPERSVQFSGKRTKRSVQKKGCTQHL